MRILILGGTMFVGRAIVDDALRGGHDVTIFSRGRTGADLFPTVPRLIGDRDSGDYRALREASWDAVVDVSGYLPRHVNEAMDALGERSGRYLFISSRAVYEREGIAPGADEDAPRRPPVRDATELTEETYGPSKVACEDDVVDRYHERATIVRPGKVAGPHDDQETFTYWSRRAARGGPIALPGRPEQPVQIVDSRDLARLVTRLLVDDRPGAFNAIGPAEPTTLGELIHTCARVAGTTVELVPVPEKVAGPLFPLVREERVWTSEQRSSAKARAAGMPATPLGVTAADVRAWDLARGEPPIPRGFTPAEEIKILQEYGHQIG
jgi:2'-hydroxyisoflavone reductase